MAQNIDNSFAVAEPAASGRAAKSPWAGLPIAALLILAAFAFGAAFFLGIPREVKALMSLGLMFALMGLGMNVGLAMGLSGALGLYAMLGTKPVFVTLAQIPFTNIASPTFLVLPMFVFMGLMLWHSGITTKLYAAARILFFWLPGGLAATTNIAGAGLGAVSGSTIGNTYALGRIAIGEMLSFGYDKRLAVGSVLSAGTIAQLIPPSIMMVIYAGFAEIPVGPQLMAGMIPGLVLALAYVLSAVVIALVRPEWVGKGKKQASVEEPVMTAAEKFRVVLGAWPVPVLILIIAGGLAGGFLTVTECASVAAIGSALYCLAARGWKRFTHAAIDAAKGTLSATGSVLFLIVGAAIFSRLLAVTGAAQWLSTNMQALSGNIVLFVVTLIILYFILGMFMDSIAMILLTVPLILPVVMAAGYSDMWFGVFLVLMAEIGVLTPPVGMLVFIGYRMVMDPQINRGQKFTLRDVFEGAMIFVPLALGVVVLIAIFPELVTWLPERMVR